MLKTKGSNVSLKWKLASCATLSAAQRLDFAFRTAANDGAALLRSDCFSNVQQQLLLNTETRVRFIGPLVFFARLFICKL